jgi:hypothetical protein
MLDDLTGRQAIDCARMIANLADATTIAPSHAARHRIDTALPPKHTRRPVEISGTAAERLARPYCRLNPHLMITRDLAVCGDDGVSVPTVYFWRRGPRDADFKELGAGGFLLPRHEDTGDHYAATSNAKLPDHIAYHHTHSPLYLFHAWAWARRRWATLLDAEGLSLCPFAFKHGYRIAPDFLNDKLIGNFCSNGQLGAFWQPGWLLALRFRFGRARVGHSPAIRRRNSQGGYIVLPNPHLHTADQCSVGEQLRRLIWDELHAQGGTADDFEDLERHARSQNEIAKKTFDAATLNRAESTVLLRP